MPCNLVANGFDGQMRNLVIQLLRLCRKLGQATDGPSAYTLRTDMPGDTVPIPADSLCGYKNIKEIIEANVLQCRSAIKTDSDMHQ